MTPGNVRKLPQLPPKAELNPIDWAGVEQAFRAGKPLRAIGSTFGCSHTLIANYAKKHGWLRDLVPRIHDQADALVANAVVAILDSDRLQNPGLETPPQPAPVLPRVGVNERVTIERNAAAEAHVRLKHRKDIAAARATVADMLKELQHVQLHPDPYAMVFDALSDPEEPALEALRDMAKVVSSLPQRANTMNTLSQALQRLIDLEREAFGLTTDGHGDDDGTPTVIVRDYTGRGSVESPFYERDKTA